MNELEEITKAEYIEVIYPQLVNNSKEKLQWLNGTDMTILFKLYTEDDGYGALLLDDIVPEDE